MIRRMLLITGLASLLGAVLSVTPAFAGKLGEKPFTMTVDSVQVNKTGAITASGTLDCSAAVAEVFGATQPPPHLIVLVNKDWDAYQTVGRTKTIHAEYRSGIASPCYQSDDPNHGPYRWESLYGFPVGTTQWVVSPDGKFEPGRIHFETFSGPGVTIVDTAVWGPGVTTSPGGDYFEIYSFGGFDLRAVRAR